ncbi:PadR family transcriptional regulator PadR [Trueperella bonasi]|uniref:PadR family transcriptional regulator PadR n=1 Tax=Trueperella bonasi TaxID=312286 RepID=A0ABT9NET0_9ACTO|nr:PadR family transcriptional regulator [Trueperella bonasi]MDP9805896.1 PadR family transcriptional regulator PadR [Trueperella bonasi]
MRETSSQMRKGTVELAILTLLARRDYYGGELVNALAEYHGLDSSSGTVYPILKRLAKARHLSTRWEESPAGPPRKYYTLTDSGRKHLHSLTANWHALQAALNAILSKD